MQNKFPEPCGIVFDIDGVLLKSHKAIPEAKEALQLLYIRAKNQIPFVFATNDGGTPEHIKASILSQELGIPIEPSQVFCSHTPFRELVSIYRKERILIVGKKREYSEYIAKDYGFENFELLEDYITRYPLLVPWKEYNTSNNSKWSICSTSTQEHTQPIKAILQLHEPVEWEEALQVLTDVLRSGGELNATGYVPDVRSPPPLHIANPDVTYAAHYSVPRFTSGAFILCLNTLYRHFTGKDLTPYLTFYGKPLRDTYRHIANLLVQRWNIQQKSFLSHSSSSTTSSSTSSFTSSFLPPPFTQIYAIGDNPLSDIRGANSVGWFSILVRTGIFQQGENDPTDPAQLVVPSVREAVQYILHKHHYLQE